MNFLFSGGSFGSLVGENYSEISSGEVRVAVGDSADVRVIRNRWYGQIEENLGEDYVSKKLYLFKLVPVPLEEGDKNYIGSHLIFFSFIFVVLLIISILDIVDRKERKEMNSSSE